MIRAAKPCFPPEDRVRVLTLIDHALEGGFLSSGPMVSEFETKMSQLVNGQGVVAVASGTSALESIFRALGVQGQEVIVSTNTYPATIWAALHAGASVKLIDIDAGTLSVSLDQLSETIGPRTKAVAVTHIGGVITPDMPLIADLCYSRNVHLVEDCAHAVGSSLNGRMAGTFGVASAFSFYPTKVMTTGEGGAVTSSDPSLLDKVRILRDQGKDPLCPDDHVVQGYNWRMSELHAAVGIVQIGNLPSFLAARRHAALFYDSLLADLSEIVPYRIPGGCSSNFYKYIILVRNGIRIDQLSERLKWRGIPLSAGVYHLPCHRQSALAVSGSFPSADLFADSHLCLPIYPEITQDEQARVVSEFKGALRKRAVV